MESGVCEFERDSRTGDAVLIAPVSAQFPANREFYREIAISGFGMLY
jgi:hypothetical protein